MLRTVLLVGLALFVALGGGAWSAWQFARRIEPLPASPGWHRLPDRAALNENPYRRDPAGRRFAPDPAPGGKLFLAATQSSEGDPLTPACTYVLAGRMPVSRIWTLSALDTSFGPLAGGPHGLASTDAVWQADGSISVTIGAEPAPGNWLPLDRTEGRFVLLVGLYGIQAGGEAAPSDVTLPPISRLRCGNEGS